MDEHDTARVQRRTLGVLVVSQIVGTIGVGVAPTIGILLAEQVMQDEALAGLARTASTLGAALVGVPLGVLAARRGRRRALSTGWWIAALGAFLIVAAAQWSLAIPLFLGLLLIGVGSATSLQARFAATDLAQPHHRARALSLVVWVGTAGSVLGPNLGVPGEVIERGSGLTAYAAAFLIAGICLALAGLVVLIWLRPDPLLLIESRAAVRPGASPGVRGGRLRQALVALRGNPRARLAVVAILTAQIVMVSIMTMTPVHIADHGGSVTIIGVTISLHVLGMYALSPIVGVIADRAGHRATIAVGIVILLAALAAAAGRPDDTGWIVASLILLGVGWSFVNVAGSALFSVVVPVESRAAAQGGVDALSNLLGAIAAFVAGPLLVVSSFATLAIVAMLVLVPLVLLVAAHAPRAEAAGAPPAV